jgi:putative transposase
VSGFSRTTRHVNCPFRGVFTNRPDHLKAFDYLGPYRYSLTFCTHERRRAFIEAPVVGLAREQILRAATEQAFAVIAYCFMPDHLHLLVEGTSDSSDCRRFISRAKQYSGFYTYQRSG